MEPRLLGVALSLPTWFNIPQVSAPEDIFNCVHFSLDAITSLVVVKFKVL